MNGHLYLCDVLPSMKSPRVLHIGAHKGQEVEGYFKAKAAAVVLVEPDPVSLSFLLARVPKVTIISAAVGESFSLSKFYRTMWSQQNSLLRPENPDAIKSKIFVATIPLSALAAFRCNVLVMDVQGGELAALKSGALSEYEYICLEVRDDTMYKKAPSSAEVVSYVVDQGFAVEKEFVGKHRSNVRDVIFRRIGKGDKK